MSRIPGPVTRTRYLQMLNRSLTAAPGGGWGTTSVLPSHRPVPATWACSEDVGDGLEL